MDKPPMIIGEAPSKSGDRYWMFPISGAVAETLCKLAGIPPQPGGSRYGQWTWALYDYFECENLIERYPGVQGRGASFPTGIARANAIAKREEWARRVVVLLGRRLADVLVDERDGSVLPFFEWRERMHVVREHDGCIISCQVVAIPHPSGLNRMLNDETTRDRTGAVLREAMQRARAATIA